MRQGFLFPEFETTKTICVKKCQRKRRVQNLHLHNGFPTEGKIGMPLLAPYLDQLPPMFIPFTKRKKNLWLYGVHCYQYDYEFEQVWSNPTAVIACLRQYPCVIGPDFSQFADQPHAFNIGNIFRNRWVTSYWQANGIKVIPSASWGNVDSFDYCFDGLPENSVIAIGHTAVGRDRSYKTLYKMGVEELVRRKRPVKLLVYGAPLDFDPGVDVVYYEGWIQKLRNNETKKRRQ